jgi:glutathione S-transferase
MESDQKNQERVLYGFWLSPYMSLVAHILAECDLPFRYERVSPFVGATQADSHKARNPLGKVPSLLDSNGLLISESQAICRYLARTHPAARKFYPCDDPVQCAEVDALGDFITFSLSGPFFNWFVVSGYYPRAFRFKVEQESRIFSSWSVVMIGDAVGRLLEGSKLSPFLLGSEPFLPDFHLFHVLRLGKTFSKAFEIPFMDLAGGDDALGTFYDVMASRPSTKAILEAQDAEFRMTERELFGEFGDAYQEKLKPAKAALQALFGHEV